MEYPTKASLRTQARKCLEGMGIEARAEASGEICGRIEGLAEWREARVVALYAAQATEPDLSALLGCAGKTFCFPRVSGDGLEFHRCNSMELLRDGPWNLLEPDPERCAVAPASEIDLLLIPGLAFTRTGGRLGRGGGFYDRFLVRVHPRAVKIGVCFHAQLVPELPVEVHDHEVDLVITDVEAIRCG